MSTYAGRPVFPGYFVDPSGNPMETVLVTVYNRGTTTKAAVYTDRTKTTGGTSAPYNPFTTDVYGNAFPYADPGEYDALVNGATIPFSVVADPAEPVTEAAIAGAVAALDLVDETDLAAEATARAAAVTAVATDLAMLEAELPGTYVPTVGAASVTGVKDFTTDEGLKFKGVQVARVNEGPLSLRDPRINVLGDGSNESAKVAAAIVLAGVNGTILIPGDLEVRVAGGQVALLDGQTLRGHGKGSRLRRFANGGGALILINTKAKVEVSDLAITGPASAAVAGDYGLRLMGTTDAAIRRIHVSGQGGDAIGLDNVANTRPTIEGNTVDGVFGHGITFTAGTVSPRILDNLVANLAAGYGYVLGYSPSYSSGALIRGNRARSISGTGGGFQYNFLEKSILSDNFATDCTHGHQVIDCRDIDVSLCCGTGGTPTASFTGSLYLARVTKSRFYQIGHDGNTGAGNYGIRIHTDVTDCWFHSIYAKRAGSHGIWNQGLRNCFYNPTSELNGGAGMYLWAATNTRVYGGQFEGNVSGGIFLGSNPAGTRIVGSEVTNYAAAGSSPPGINVGANSANCRIDDADIHDIGAGTPIVVSASGTSTTFVRQLGHATALVKAGIPADGDFPSPPENGTYAVDSSNNRIYVRVGGVWKYAALT